MKLPICYVVDVGHGNATVLCDKQGVLIVDTGLKQRLLQFLLANKITNIDFIIISHVDYDHIAGVIDILLSPHISVSSVVVNPDPSQNSDTWYDIKVALSNAQKRNGTVVNTGLHSGLTGTFDQGDIHVEVLAPDLHAALSGIGGKDKKGRPIDRHYLNAVIRLSHGENSALLIPGDTNKDGLDFLQEEVNNLSSDIVIFPHHGGRPGSTDPIEFTKQIMESTNAKQIIFSVASGRRHHPRKDIIDYIDSLNNGEVMWSTGNSFPIQDLIDADANCAHKNRMGDLILLICDDPITVESLNK